VRLAGPGLLTCGRRLRAVSFGDFDEVGNRYSLRIWRPLDCNVPSAQRIEIATQVGLKTDCHARPNYFVNAGDCSCGFLDEHLEGPVMITRLYVFEHRPPRDSVSECIERISGRLCQVDFKRVAIRERLIADIDLVRRVMESVTVADLQSDCSVQSTSLERPKRRTPLGRIATRIVWIAHCRKMRIA
jgi:hypothetical protein